MKKYIYIQQLCQELCYNASIITSNSPPEDLAWSTEMVWTTAWICVHALTKKLQVFHCKNRHSQQLQQEKQDHHL